VATGTTLQVADARLACRPVEDDRRFQAGALKLIEVSITAADQ
jgi:hypothetical protein